MDRKRSRFFDWIKIKVREIKKEIYVLAIAYRHPATPWYAKVFTAIVVAYAFSPIDLVPDFIPILGYLDDVILVPLGITLALRMIPDEVLKEARLHAVEELEKGDPKNWWAGTIIILIWVILAASTLLKIIRWFQD